MRTSTQTQFTIESKFPPIRSGSDCDGRAIRDAGGKTVGTLSRQIEWVDVGAASARYAPKVKGYVLADWRNEDESEVEYASLSEAMAAARKAFPGLKLS